MTIQNRSRKLKYDPVRGLVKVKGKGRRKANPHKFCNCKQCRWGRKKSRSRLYKKEARRNNRRLRNGEDVHPIGYTD
jgi:hypothetical protein